MMTPIQSPITAPSLSSPTMTSIPLSEYANICAVSEFSSSWMHTANTVFFFIFLTLMSLILIMGAIDGYKTIKEERQRFQPPNPNDTEEGRDARRKIWERVESEILTVYVTTNPLLYK
ncbi:uncharacterized protein Bfra_009531 [Botrytis fragariae]|uniref:Uncharacterized protein n=1 Tax=Botrytis fragariae TaxID=1964551 RepID=A0A8H6EG26_9HELO|nr:uncharacterized protein Bfra_009531 [Botrytis fragariae]KAF5870977.1 hypothetical protein Bfra_009531 [Botrytis fragariae]